MKAFVYIVIAVVAVAVVLGFMAVGSPAAKRVLDQDVRRVNDLQLIQSQIISYWQANRTLPASLSVLRGGSMSIPRDPATDADYEYTIAAKDTFSLCANFAKPTPKMTAGVTPYGPDTEYWQHGEGHVCFQKTLTPDLYPPTQPPMPKGVPAPIPVQPY